MFRNLTLIKAIHASTNIPNTHFEEEQPEMFEAAFDGEYIIELYHRGLDMLIRVQITTTQSGTQILLYCD